MSVATARIATCQLAAGSAKDMWARNPTPQKRVPNPATGTPRDQLRVATVGVTPFPGLENTQHASPSAIRPRAAPRSPAGQARSPVPVRPGAAMDSPPRPLLQPGHNPTASKAAEELLGCDDH